MDKYNKFQILKFTLIVALLIIVPLFSSSLRPTYLYFVFNLLIITLGAEAGLISFFSEPLENKNLVVVTLPRTPALALEVSPAKEGPTQSPLEAVRTVFSPDCNQEKAKEVEKSSSMKIVGTVRPILEVKKCPSMPSLFFIGGGEVDESNEDMDVEEEEVGVPTKQELFHKAETFIGNFYKQLKMQREDSWKRIHGFYHKTF